MFGCVIGGTADAGEAARDAAAVCSPDRGYGIESIVQTISGVLSLNAYALLDAVAMPDPTKATCKGPKISDGAGQSCEDVDIPCEDKLRAMCNKIDQLPNVSRLFRSCMKGRCGCGRSFFPRAVISCDDVSSCGGCRGSADGCYTGGARIYYCYADTIKCECVRVIFHEMAHACGALDQTGASYRIGNWFATKCAEMQVWGSEDGHILEEKQ